MEEIYLKWLKKTDNISLLVRACRMYFGIDEEWKDIFGWEGLYQISSFGRIKSLKRILLRNNGHKQTIKERILKMHTRENKYTTVCLIANCELNTLSVHRIVGAAFIPNPNLKVQINHKNGIKKDNRKTNLEWNTASENMIHAANNGLLNSHMKNKLGEAVYNSKKVSQFTKDGKFVKTHEAIASASRELNIQRSDISACCRGKVKSSGGYIWKYY